MPGWFPVPVFGRTGDVISDWCVGARRQRLPMVFEAVHRFLRNPGVWECGLSRSRRLPGGNRGGRRAVSRQGSRDPLVYQRVVPDTPRSSCRQRLLLEQAFVRQALLLRNEEPRRKG